MVVKWSSAQAERPTIQPSAAVLYLYLEAAPLAEAQLTGVSLSSAPLSSSAREAPLVHRSAAPTTLSSIAVANRSLGVVSQAERFSIAVDNKSSLAGRREARPSKTAEARR